MNDEKSGSATFDGDPDWRFPLRLGLPPTPDAKTFGDAFFADLWPLLETLVVRVDLAIDGCDCDIAVVRSPEELALLRVSLSVSANFVLVLVDGIESVDRKSAFAAARALGASGYAIARGPADERLRSFVDGLAGRATIQRALGESGVYELAGNDSALAVPPLTIFLDTVKSIDLLNETTFSHLPADMFLPRSNWLRHTAYRTLDDWRRYTSDAMGLQYLDLTRGFPVQVTAEMAGGTAANEINIVEGDSAKAPEIAEALTADETDHYFTHLGDGAAIAAGLGRDNVVAATLDILRGPSGPPPRFLQAALHRRNDDGTPGDQILHGFLRNQPMTILVGIGPLGPMRMACDVRFDEQQLGEAERGGWDLSITLKRDDDLVIVRRKLQLPESGSSKDVEFPIDIGEASGTWRARITVWHQSRAIQSAVISGRVLDADVDPGGGRQLSLTVDGEFRTIAKLNAHTRGGATVEFDNKPAVYTEDAEWRIDPQVERMRTASNNIATELGEKAVLLDKATDLEGQVARQFLLYMAVQGSNLFAALLPNTADQAARDALRKEPFLQALRLSHSAPELPYEFIYDLPSPPTNYTLCTDWVNGTDAGECPRCHAPEANNRNILCPLGFWGLRKVIERHNAPKPQDTRALACLRRGNIAGQAVIQLRHAAIALSDKADELWRGAPKNYVVPSQRILKALHTAHVSSSGLLTNWDAWRAAVKNQEPDLLIILAHANFDNVRGEYSMEIGSGDALPASLVFPEEVDVPAGTPGPVVLLLGCLTAPVNWEQATFASKFLENNASVVIGTTSAVLGRQSGSVAADLVASIKKSGGEVQLGEMLRQARIQGLKANSLMAMALNAFGDADHRVSI
jgi:hypothetical protein